MSSFCVHVKSSNYNTHVENLNCVDKFLPSVLNIPTFSYVNLYIQMSSSVALSLDISPFVAWYLGVMMATCDHLLNIDTGMPDSVR